MTRSRPESPRAPGAPIRDSGFTLLELMVALLILGIVMTAVAPAIYETMAASASSDQRSVADGLAVAATEQIRALPYYEVGHDTTPAACTGTDPVVLSWSTPMDPSPTYQAASNTRFQTVSCVYWVTASDGSSQAYKQVVVTVRWGSSYQFRYLQESALYPGGESAYSSAENNFPPPQLAQSSSGTAPPTPTADGATPVSSSIVQVDWKPVSYSGSVQYEIQWWAAASPEPSIPNSVVVNGTPDTNPPNSAWSGDLEYQVTNLAGGTAYDFDVIAVSGSASQPSPPSNVVTATTASSTSVACGANGITVTPSGSGQPVIDSSGNLVNVTSLTVTVTPSSAACTTGYSVEYGVNGSNGQPGTPLSTVSLTYVSGSSGGYFTGSTPQGGWSATTYGFVVYINDTATTAQANVTPCQERGSSGHC